MNDPTELIAWIKNLPPGTVVKWGANCIDDKRLWAIGWVDVLVPELMELLGWNWIWTIERPTWIGDLVAKEKENNELWSFVLEPDLEVHGATVDGFWEPMLALGLDEVAPLELQNSPGYDSVPGWTVEVLNRGLANWCAQHADRTDITFEFDDGIEDPALIEAEASVLAMKNGEAESYVLFEDSDTGGTIQASEQVMEFFMRNPELGAEAMEHMKEVLDQHFKKKEED